MVAYFFFQLQLRLEQLMKLPFTDDSEEMTERRRDEMSAFCNALMGVWKLFAHLSADPNVQIYRRLK